MDKSEFHYPEGLIKRREVVISEKKQTGSILPPSQEEIAVRRASAINSCGTAHYQTSLLANIATAHLGILSEYRSRQSLLGKDGAQTWIKETLDSMNLTLYGVKGSYERAIDTTKYYPSGASTGQIFYGKGITVYNGDNLEISSNYPTKKDGTEYPTFVVICQKLISDPSMKSSCKKTLEFLKELESKKSATKWYCYGQMKIEDKRIVICPASWDHIYIY